ncbi:short chain enoyl-CoA hydratase [Aneurinibacillus soli]|uniref:Enoyl-CoA hydratase domain-containing protein 3, mitochondrial n=1 Tax=Aneurinibacillus soli TaxID=1500254 RepID=A0A0U5C404_9BACL|nr:enoyl-CoA hydratase [Aneurinibacillus soli]PYE60140.1 short chain enoyl-CoA hydratase [Aneurinibacillus soli]BAU26371.1 putative enoyl-CoA hydratase echA8 [Aneurinibacillus soli]
MADTKTADYQHVLFETEGPIAHVTMNRPTKRNALSLEHMQELIGVLETISNNQKIAVVILKGSGPAFCAGHDLSEMPNQSPVFYRHLFDVCTKLMETIQSIPQPVIAQVHGIATAAGCQLVATCDLAVAEENAKFATPGVKIGLFCSTPMVALTRAVGRKKAMEMLLTGEALDSEGALLAGLINRAVPAEDLENETKALAQKIAAASTFTVGIGKQAFYKQIEMPQPLAYSYAKEVMSLNATAADAEEGICAFLEKRPPNWKGC